MQHTWNTNLFKTNKESFQKLKIRKMKTIIIILL